MDMYADFIKERENLEIIKNSLGFLTYKVNGEECFIANFYIEPKSRRGPALHWFIEEVSQRSKVLGAKRLTGTIDVYSNGASRVMAAALKVGFNIIRAENGIILISKEIK